MQPSRYLIAFRYCPYYSAKLPLLILQVYEEKEAQLQTIIASYEKMKEEVHSLRATEVDLENQLADISKVCSCSSFVHPTCLNFFLFLLLLLLSRFYQGIRRKHRCGLHASLNSIANTVIQ